MTHTPSEHKNTTRWYDHVYGGWLGKTIGGTLGMPYEGMMQLLDVRGYDTTLTTNGSSQQQSIDLPSTIQPAANDDLDLQLVNLHALEQYGPRLQATQIGQEWIEHVFFPFDEYGYALANLRRGLLPPLAGWFNNPFIDCMGAPIRSELWAMLTPGHPEIAAHYAWQDALVDHAGGEGAYGEVFFATIECQAFIDHDRDRLIACGLRAIPEHCRVAQAVRHVLSCAASGLSWQQTRESVLAHFGHKNFTDAPQNIAFTIIGWLYGRDFGDAVLTAINCGYDTDCTGATLGAILGIIAGASALPQEWCQPVGNRVVVSDPIHYLDAPTTLEELTERTLRVAQETQAFWHTHSLTDAHNYREVGYSHQGSRLKQHTDQEISPTIIWPQHVETRMQDDTIALSVGFQDHHPAIGAGQTRTVYIRITNNQNDPWQGTLELTPPTGWTVSTKEGILLPPHTTNTFIQSLTADDAVHTAYQVMLHLTRTYAATAWHTITMPIALVPARQWRISTQNSESGPTGGSIQHQAVNLPYQSINLPSTATTEQLTVAGDTLHLPTSFANFTGILEASTILHNPHDRMVRLVIVAHTPVEVELDGQPILHTTASSTALPTLHRPEEGSFCDRFIAAGRHQLTLRFSHHPDGQHDTSITVVAASANDSMEPGPYYYLTDLLFL